MQQDIETPHFLQIVDETHEVLFQNQALLDLLGRAGTGLRGEKCWSLVKEDRQPCASCPLQRGIAPGETRTIKVEGLLGNLLGQITCTGIVYQGRKAVIEIFSDVTTQYAQEVAADTLYNVVKQTADIVMITDQRGIIEYVNPAFEQATGYSRDEVLGRTPSILKSGKHEEQFYRHLWEVILSGQVYHGILVNKKKSGELYYSEKTISPIKNQADQITHFVSTDRDITRRKEAEEDLQQANSQLKFQVDYLEQFYRLRIRLAEAHTPDQVLSLVGQALVQIDGQQAVQEVVLTYGGKEWRFGQSAETSAILYWRPLWQHTPQRGKVSVWCARQLSALEERMLLEETSGQLAQVLEARELQLQLVQSARLVSLGQMAAGVAHELNQPLMAISTTAEDVYLRLDDKLPLPPEQLSEMMQDVLGMVGRMKQVIDQLRVFSRDTSQEPGTRFSLNQVVEACLRLVRTQLKIHGIQLRLELSPTLPAVQGHPHQLEQVLLNLLTNARDALDEKEEGDKWLVVRTHSEGGQVVLEVEDSGTGMDAAVQERVFEPFFTTKPADRGTGLGLSIAYAIVQNHGGSITCHSHKGHGSTFLIQLPPQ